MRKTSWEFSHHGYGDMSGVDVLRATGRATVRVVRQWTTALDGSKVTVAGNGFLDDEESIKAQVLDRSKQFGWTPKKWWQFWRWDDTPNPKD